MKYFVKYEFDESNWWFTSIPEVDGCVTEGRTLDEARDRIRECLSLFVSDREAKEAELVDCVELPGPVSAAVRTLSECGIPSEDMGYLLESHPA